MPVISATQQAALCAAVATRFGQPIRYPSHCEALEASIAQAQPQDGRLSVNTLRRFFGLVKKTGGYHLHTLDALARYAGHADFEAFVEGTFTPATTADPIPEIPELLAFPRLQHAERLLMGYFLGQITRTDDFTANALALRLAAHPAGQEYFVESYVDLAYLNGAYGQVVREYLRHKKTPEAQLYGHSVLFLGEFLAEDEPAWQARLQHLLALSIPPDTHPFPRGRRSFAEIAATWYAAPTQPLPAVLWEQLLDEATQIPILPTDAGNLPPFYNYFPAGYYFLVAEAFFLTNQFEPLAAWIALTLEAYPALRQYEHNVFNELLRAFQAVAALRTGTATTWDSSSLSAVLETHTWLRDYYQVHCWLAGLHFAVAGTPDPEAATRIREQINRFAHKRRMPFYASLAARIA
ncbi:hypothetical protein [Hymenobacter sp. BT730]|uniref:hypothetical protein n=1 Tax=Hymenobacter sp. BT730 TaxID=3063332 RepID=UPI0026DEAB6E|nr:hypothetical protein [Hymenobacter sp. BT730]